MAIVWSYGRARRTGPFWRNGQAKFLREYGNEQINITDSGIGTDIISLLNNLSIVDSGTGTDVVSLINNMNIADSGIGTDIVSLLNNLNIADSGIGTDIISIQTPHSTVNLGRLFNRGINRGYMRGIIH